MAPQEKDGGGAECRADGDCTDANPCNGEETCASPGVCVAGVALEVDDGNPCTHDACAASSGVTHLPSSPGTPCGFGACDGFGVCVEGAPLPLLGAPPLAPGAANTTDLAGFLYEGEDPLQVDVEASVIGADRVGLLTGRVLSNGLPLAGARVEVRNEPAFGFTSSRDDGVFQMAANGNRIIELRVSAPGMLTADRKVWLRPGSTASIADVALVGLTDVHTVVAATSAGPQTALGPIEIDDRGERQASVYFPPNNLAWVERDDGTALMLDTLTVRQTEYTVGDDGPARMPAPLPFLNGYTYAVELSVDEALAIGAEHVHFVEPVSFYVDNFLDFNTGGDVPVGFYDRKRGLWVPVPNGRIIEIVDLADGLAVLDVDGDTLPDSGEALARLGIDDDELRELALTRSVGATLWRARLPHFSPWDLNWPYDVVAVPDPEDEDELIEPEPSGEDPDGEDDDEGEDSTTPCEEGGPTTSAGSIISIERQSLGERVPLPGTSLALRYESATQPGERLSRTLRVPFERNRHPDFYKRFITLNLLGRSIRVELPNSAEPYVFTWDGLDFAGRPAYGVHRVDIITEEVYRARPVASPAEFGAYTWGTDYAVSSDVRVGTVTFTNTFSGTVASWPEYNRFGGWSLEDNHVYSREREVLFDGRGTQRTAWLLPDTSLERIWPFAGSSRDFVAILPKAGQAASGAELGNAVDIAFAPDGIMYVSTSKNQVWKIVDGALVHVAGTGRRSETAEFLEWLEPIVDGSLATSVDLHEPTAMDFAPDGTLYLLSRSKIRPELSDLGSRVHVITPDGIIRLFPGMTGPPITGVSGPFMAGRTVTDMVVDNVRDMWVAADGGLFLAHYYGLLRVGTSGVYGTVMDRDNVTTPPQDPRAPIFRFDSYSLFAEHPNGDVWVTNRHGVARIGTDGRLHSVVDVHDHPSSTPQERYDLRTQSLRDLPLDVRGITIAADGTVYLLLINGFTDDDGDHDTSSILRIRGDEAVRVFSGPSLETVVPRYSEDSRVVNQTIGVDAEANLYVVDLYNGSFGLSDGRIIYQITSPYFEREKVCDIEVPSDDGRDAFCFNKNGVHERTVDALSGGVRMAFEYDERGRIAGVTDAAGQVTTFEYHDGFVDVMGPLGQTTRLSYDGWGRLAEILAPTGAALGFEYDASGLLSGLIRPSGARSEFAYGADGRLIRDTDPLGNAQVLERTNLVDGYTVSHTTPLGRKTEIASGATRGGRDATVHKAPDGLESVTTTRAIAGGAVRTSVAADGTVTRVVLGYNPLLGGASPVVDRVETLLPSGASKVVSMTRQRLSGGYRDVLTENGGNRRTTTQAESSDKIVTTSVSAEGRSLTVTTDGARRVTQVARGTSLPVEYQYGPEGYVSSARRGNRTRTLEILRAPAGVEDLAPLPGAFLVRRSTNPEGEVERVVLDVVGRPIAKIYADGAVLRTAYDANGNTLAVVPPLGGEHLMSYDPRDLLQSYVAPSVQQAPHVTSYAYDADKQRVQVVRADGRVINTIYDAAGRAEEVISDSGIVAFEYYDAEQCEGCAPGRLRSMSGPSDSTSTFSYDGAYLTGLVMSGMVAAEVRWSLGAHLKISSESASAGGQTHAYFYAHDRDGLVTCVAEQACSAAGTSALRVAYDTNGYAASDAMLGLQSTRTFNAHGELATLQATFEGTALFAQTVHSEAAPRDGLGRVVAAEDTQDGEVHVSQYAYDARGRLLSETLDGVSIVYTYDDNDNRLTVTAAGATNVWTHDSQDRLLSDGTFEYTYDEAGALVRKRAIGSGAETLYSRSATGALREVTLSDGREIVYVVDAKGRPIAKEIDGTRTRAWVYGGNLRVTAELDGAGALRWHFGYVGFRAGAPDLMARDGQVFRVVKDHVGSVRLVVNAATGEVAQSLRYGAFGEVLADSNPGFQPFGFAGGLYDTDTGLVRFGARDYDPRVGRWTSKDPVRFEGGQINLYAYVGSDPVNRTDPTGLRFRFPDNDMGWTEKQFGPLFEELSCTQVGRDLLYLLESSEEEWLLEGLPYEDENGNVYAGFTWHGDDGSRGIYVDTVSPSDHMYSSGGSGQQTPATAAQIFAHELGHAVGNAHDDGEDRMANVREWENRFNNEVGRPARCSYGPVLESYDPSVCY